jgi:hypothetical protein
MLERTIKNIATVGLLAVVTACSGVVGDEVSELALLPNIEALPAEKLQLDNTSFDGRILLRFDTITWNNGAGPLELVAGEPIAGKKRVNQVIYLQDGTTQSFDVGTFTFHEAEGHDHFHYDEYAIYDLKAPEGSDVVVPSGLTEKTSFCMWDSDQIDLTLPGAPLLPGYVGCDDTMQGMSVGWGDRYPRWLADQWIEVTNVESGIYELSIRANPNANRPGGLLESDYSDNTSVITIALDLDPSVTNGGTVTVLDGLE